MQLAIALPALLVTTVLKVALNSQQVFAMLVITVQQDKLHHSQPLMFVQLEAIVKSDLVNKHLVDQATTIQHQE